MIKLDQFQIDGIQEIKSNNNVLVVAPTGSGKTLIANEAIKYYLKKIIKYFTQHLLNRYQIKNLMILTKMESRQVY